jgi:DNA-binding FadR family transcriptional regulator
MSIGQGDRAGVALLEVNMVANQTTEFLECLIERTSPGDRMPAIPELANQLGISTSKLREQLEVARALGLVEVRPKTGIKVLPYSFGDSLRVSLQFALALDRSYFDQIGELRNHIEAAFWHEAVGLLTDEDKASLQELVRSAWAKLRGQPVRIPHAEHRDLHLTIYSRLQNEFVTGLLESYWEAYEAVGLALYTDYSYLEQVWRYHEQMVKAILANDLEAGYHALIVHTDLLQQRPRGRRDQDLATEVQHADEIEPGLVEEE